MFIEQSVLSSVHCDNVAAQQRAAENAENALAVVHLCHTFSIPGQGV